MTNPNDGTAVPMEVPEIITGSERLARQFESWDDTTSAAETATMVRRLAAELDRCSDYGRRMWHHLELVATYLRDDVARASSGPVVLREDDQRGRWADLYATTLSILAGVRGDSGFGVEQARAELQNLDR